MNLKHNLTLFFRLDEKLKLINDLDVVKNKQLATRKVQESLTKDYDLLKTQSELYKNQRDESQQK